MLTAHQVGEKQPQQIRQVLLSEIKSEPVSRLLLTFISEAARRNIQEKDAQPKFASISPWPYSTRIAGVAAPQMENLGQATQREGIEIVPGFQMTLDQADAALDLYRSAYIPYFPFVPISTEVAASELRETAPFLLRAILQATSPQTLSIQKAVQLWFREQIAQRVVIHQERSLELLQAILVFVAW